MPTTVQTPSWAKAKAQNVKVTNPDNIVPSEDNIVPKPDNIVPPARCCPMCGRSQPGRRAKLDTPAAVAERERKRASRAKPKATGKYDT